MSSSTATTVYSDMAHAVYCLMTHPLAVAGNLLIITLVAR